MSPVYEGKSLRQGSGTKNLQKQPTPLKINILTPKMEVWKMIFLFNLVIFLGSMLIFQGESGGRSDHRGRILEERFEDFQWCHWNYTPLVLRYMFL